MLVGYLTGQAPASATPWLLETADDVYSLHLDPVAKAEEIESDFSRAIQGRAVASQGRAVLVGVATPGERSRLDSSMTELKELARTASVEVLDVFIQARPKLDSRFIIGEGKLAELNLRAMQIMADMLIFEHDLTPLQVRHLTDSTSFKVLDRTANSFWTSSPSARRRRTANFRWSWRSSILLPRLTQRDDSLSRLAGGIGGRGPGETKLESDRRRVRTRIAMLESRVQELSTDRQIRRQKRDRQGVPVISIVGYTNAGKSTLLNSLTDSSVLAENKLFATLDTTSRRLRFPRIARSSSPTRWALSVPYRRR